MPPWVTSIGIEVARAHKAGRSTEGRSQCRQNQRLNNRSAAHAHARLPVGVSVKPAANAAKLQCWLWLAIRARLLSRMPKLSRR